MSVQFQVQAWYQVHPLCRLYLNLFHFGPPLRPFVRLYLFHHHRYQDLVQLDLLALQVLISGIPYTDLDPTSTG